MSIRALAASLLPFSPTVLPDAWDNISKFIFGLYSAKEQKPRWLGKTFEHSVGPTIGTFTLGNCKLEVDIDRSSTIHPSKRAPELEAKDAYAFIKSTLANKEIVENGLKLEVVDDSGAVKDISKYTAADKKNLALCLHAAKENGLHVVNEEELFKKAGIGPFAHTAKDKYADFRTITDDSRNPAYKESIQKLEEMGKEDSIGKMRGLLTENTGFMLRKSGYMTPADEARVGDVQGEILAIRRKILAKGDTTALIDKLPKNTAGNVDMFILITDDAKRAALLADTDLGITAAERTAAINKVNDRKGVESFANHDVPQSGFIQERLCVDQDTKRAVIAAQQFERLMSDIQRLKNVGADPVAAAMVKDLRIDPVRDSDVTKSLQPVRIELNRLEKAAAAGVKFDASHLLSAPVMQQWATDIQSLFVDSIAAQTEIAKGRAVGTLWDYAKKTQAYHIDKLFHGSAATPAPVAPATPPPPPPAGPTGVTGTAGPSSASPTGSTVSPPGSSPLIFPTMMSP